MVCIAEVAIAMKVAELAKRCGLKASEVDGYVYSVDEDKDPEGKGYYAFHFVDTYPETAEDAAKIRKFFDLLEMKGTEVMKGPALKDLEDRADRALSLAPRARTL